ncbi:MAG: polysaccharide deacetylase family protein [Treponema sp.]|jgi:peptidoglycan/xylan/chitin deacetylase (PgdA/CDA1 family)|nr:polysaccharide deacetylase family protein [Treponema sp.]
MKKHSLLLVFFFALILSGFGKIQFSGLDISEDNRLLFRAGSRGGGAETQSALFYAQLPPGPLRSRPGVPVEQLSVFPEKMDVLEGGKFLLVHNAFGSQQISLNGGLPRSFPGFASFASFTGSSRAEATAVSPDGKWLLYVEGVSHAKGNLTLLDGETGKKIRISAGVERPGRFFPARWSADSRGFLYAKDGRLYFHTLNALSAPPDERYRLVGEGAVNSLYWGGGGLFYYLKDSIVYRVRSEELFARTLYAGFLELGEVAGKLPFEFDPNFDSFWISPDGLSMLLCKGGRNIFYYPLGINDDTETDYASLPYIMAPRASSRIDVLWSSEGIITVMISAAPGGDRVTVYRLFAGTPAGFQAADSPPALASALSPDGKYAALWGKRGLFLYDYRTWKPLSLLVSSPVYSAAWLGNNELAAGGETRIERLTIGETGTAERRLLCLSSVSRYGFEERPGSKRRVLALAGNTWYVTDGVSPWIEYGPPALRDPSVTSAAYRVYLETGGGYFFENVPMVRNTTSVGTFPLLETAPSLVPERPSLLPGNPPGRFPGQTEPSYVFSHGQRSLRELALCFDLYDDAAGLSAVLEVLYRYRIRATFFLNGEFIRRYPRAAGEIAAAGHEVASMFYTPIDFADSRYRIDRAFITRGLARNEDEFFRATGREISLLWHPPFYALSREIAAAAESAGYKTVGRDVDSRDWILTGEAKRLGIEQLSAADMINLIMDAKEGGSIIPIRLGLLPGGRAGYLFNSLEILLDALFREGYEVVPVSTLIGKSR